MKFKVEEKYINTRLDKYLRKKFVVNLNELFKYIGNGKIQVNFEKVRQNYRLKEDDIVYIKESIKLEEKKGLILSHEEIKMIDEAIIYEDDKVLLLNKPANIVMHKGSGHDYGLSEMMKVYTQLDTFTFANRIDRATSGLIIGCKDMETTRLISDLIAKREVDKKYYILVEGQLKGDFEIKSYLVKNKYGVKEYKEWVEDSKESISYFKVIKKYKEFTLLEATLGTGRTHQLRVQLSSQGNVIVGDQKYGSTYDTKMHLFSHRVVIDRLNLDINLDVPNWFMTKKL